MSEMTDKAEQELMNALSDTLPGPVVSFVAMATYLSEDGGEKWVVLDAPEQHIGTGLGLVKGLELAYTRFFQDQHEAAGEDEDDL